MKNNERIGRALSWQIVSNDNDEENPPEQTDVEHSDWIRVELFVDENDRRVVDEGQIRSVR